MLLRMCSLLSTVSIESERKKQKNRKHFPRRSRDSQNLQTKRFGQKQTALGQIAGQATREKEREPERKRERKELDKKVEAQKATEEAARQEQARAAKVAAKARAEEPPQYHLPHLTETIKYFEQGLPKCAIDVLKDRALLTAAQKETLRKSVEQSANRMKDFATRL